MIIWIYFIAVCSVCNAIFLRTTVQYYVPLKFFFLRIIFIIIWEETFLTFYYLTNVKQTLIAFNFESGFT